MTIAHNSSNIWRHKVTEKSLRRPKCFSTFLRRYNILKPTHIPQTKSFYVYTQEDPMAKCEAFARELRNSKRRNLLDSKKAKL